MATGIISIIGHAVVELAVLLAGSLKGR